MKSNIPVVYKEPFPIRSRSQDGVNVTEAQVRQYIAKIADVFAAEPSKSTRDLGKSLKKQPELWLQYSPLVEATAHCLSHPDHHVAVGWLRGVKFAQDYAEGRREASRWASLIHIAADVAQRDGREPNEALAELRAAEDRRSGRRAADPKRPSTTTIAAPAPTPTPAPQRQQVDHVAAFNNRVEQLAEQFRSERETSHQRQLDMYAAKAAPIKQMGGEPPAPPKLAVPNDHRRAVAHVAKHEPQLYQNMLDQVNAERASRRGRPDRSRPTMLAPIAPRPAPAPSVPAAPTAEGDAIERFEQVVNGLVAKGMNRSAALDYATRLYPALAKAHRAAVAAKFGARR